MKKVLVVTGEASGDLHGANLVKALLQKHPDLHFAGMGGSEMAAAGVDILFDAHKVSVVGIAEVFSHLGDIIKAQAILKNYLKREKPDLLIIIDLPDFNLLIAKKAKQLSIPVFYYICPQVWAWRSSRVKTIAQRVDTVGVILPFEEEFLRQRGVDAQYVGHPLLDSVKVTLNRDSFSEKYRIPAGSICVGLLPGSREKEISALLPDFLESALLLQKRSVEPISFLLPLASTIRKSSLYQSGLREFEDQLDIRVITDDRYNLMARCDAVVAASGTVTLELALLDTPMVVTYRVAPFTYRIGRMLIKLKHFSLVNLIAGEEIVPELLQQEVTPEAISNQLQELLFDQESRTKCIMGLEAVRKKMGGEGASSHAADLALKILDNS
ncbi:lipid-A-disaccharide synthase [Desulfopila sp. IMCC35008]|uniref:lipid-A-disaccharide synthase n=1 Tax=Desulfopila sp. IMCC35008 TaxID=2653858 RepID=UPI0013D72346|nr:lipid-A-disaccharide synthase [Desulfopila sp. IMCC35008]